VVPIQAPGVPIQVVGVPIQVPRVPIQALGMPIQVPKKDREPNCVLSDSGEPEMAPRVQLWISYMHIARESLIEFGTWKPSIL
jgi:hypothetical protein